MVNYSFTLPSKMMGSDKKQEKINIDITCSCKSKLIPAKTSLGQVFIAEEGRDILQLGHCFVLVSLSCWKSKKKKKKWPTKTDISFSFFSFVLFISCELPLLPLQRLSLNISMNIPSYFPWLYNIWIVPNLLIWLYNQWDHHMESKGPWLHVL